MESPTVMHAIRSVPILRNHSGLSICNMDRGMFCFMILASDSRHKQSNASFLGSPVVDEERMRYEANECFSLAGVSALSVLHCSDTVGRVIGKTHSQNTVQLILKGNHLQQVTETTKVTTT